MQNLSPLPNHIYSAPVYDLFKNRFKDLNKKTNPGLIDRILRFIFQSSNFVSTSVSWSVHVAVEHLGRGKFSGNPYQNSINHTLDLIRKMHPVPTKMEKALSYAQSVANGKTTQAIKADIKSLQVGESVLIPSVIPQHCMMMQVTCTKDENGKKTYRIEHHNGGFGIDDYHYHKVEENGKILFQTGLIIEEVPGENLFGDDSEFIQQILSAKDSNKGPYVMKTVLYEKILPSAGGIVAPPNEDNRYWQPGQVGGSCTYSCIRSLLRANSSEEEYSHFEEYAAYELFLKSYEQIKSGEGNTTIRKIATLEMIKELEHRFVKKGTKVPEEILEARYQLEILHLETSSSKSRAQIEKNLKNSAKNKNISLNNIALNKPALSLDKGKRLQSTDAVDNINIAFTILKEGEFSAEAFLAAEPYLSEATQNKNSLSYDLNSVEKLQLLHKALSNYREENPITRQQFYYLTAISSAIAFVSSNLKNSDRLARTQKLNKFYEEVDASNRNIHRGFNNLLLGSSSAHNTPIGRLIASFQTKFYGANTPMIPSNMKKMIQAFEQGPVNPVQNAPQLENNIMD